MYHLTMYYLFGDLGRCTILLLGARHKGNKMYYLTMYDVLFANYNGTLVTLMCNLGAVALFFCRILYFYLHVPKKYSTFV